jgi:hypothetical protein
MNRNHKLRLESVKNRSPLKIHIGSTQFIGHGSIAKISRNDSKVIKLIHLSFFNSNYSGDPVNNSKINLKIIAFSKNKYFESYPV